MFQPWRFPQDFVLPVAGDHDQFIKKFFRIEVVDEAAAAAAWLHSRIEFILSSDDYGPAAFHASHGSLR